MKASFSLRPFLTFFAIVLAILIWNEKACAQSKQVSVCDQINNTAIFFVKLVDEAKKKVDNKTFTTEDKIAIDKEFGIVEGKFSNPNTLPEYVDFDKYLLIRSTVVYYNFLYKLKDYQQIVELGKKTFTYPDGLKAENCKCDVKGYVTYQHLVIDEEFGNYIASKEVQATVGTMKVGPSNLYNLFDALLSIVAISAHHIKNYEVRDQFFSKTFKMGYLDWGSNVTPYALSLAIFKTYTEGQPIKDVELSAAIAYLNVLKLRTPEQLNASLKIDSTASVLAKNIIIKTCGDKLNPITNLDPILYIKAVIAFLRDKNTSSAAKADLIKANFTFLTKATQTFNENWSYKYENFFRVIDQETTASILMDPDANFVNGFVDYVVRYESTILKVDVNGQLAYDVYLYCKQKKDKRAKELYKWIEYRKDRYPTFVK